MLIETDELRLELEADTRDQVELIEEAIQDNLLAIDLLTRVNREHQRMRLLIDRLERKAGERRAV